MAAHTERSCTGVAMVLVCDSCSVGFVSVSLYFCSALLSANNTNSYSPYRKVLVLCLTCLTRTQLVAIDDAEIPGMPMSKGAGSAPSKDLLLRLVQVQL
jgi:hypothetical protein